MYKELVLKSLHNRNTIVPINEITYEPRDYEAYQSLFQYSADIYEYVHLQGGVSGFNGKLYTKEELIDEFLKTKEELSSLHLKYEELIKYKHKHVN